MPPPSRVAARRALPPPPLRAGEEVLWPHAARLAGAGGAGAHAAADGGAGARAVGAAFGPGRRGLVLIRAAILVRRADRQRGVGGLGRELDADADHGAGD